jgi:tRNA threonylcarbamoyl adenosine modification protein YeaZ
MKILALELSSARGSVAWLNEDVDLAREWPNDRKNSALFFENLKEISEKFGAAETIVVGLGPGSYAGTRIAISAAIGLEVASNARLVGLPSICAIECDQDEYCVIGDARRQSFFFARIRANDLIEGPTLVSEAELHGKIDKREEKMSIFATEELPQFRRVEVRYPSAVLLARLARDANRSFVLPPLEPMYLREPHITVPKTAARSTSTP